MSDKQQFRSGVVAIVGRSNTGKSTLLNHLAGEKVTIVSESPQTTRTCVRVIFNDARGQIVFLDTPGMHVCRHALDRAMISSIHDALSGADVILHLVDISRRVGEEERMVIESLEKTGVFVVLGLNKADKSLKYERDHIVAWERKIGGKLDRQPARVLPLRLSGLTGLNTHRLLEELFKHLPVGPALYPDDVLTDFPKKLAIQDAVREKLLVFLKDEMPFAIAVLADEIVERSPKLTVIHVTIFVERNSQKAIVIGRGGELMKKVGEAARRDIEDMYGKKVYLDLWVKIEKKWKQDHQLLKQIGYVM